MGGKGSIATLTLSAMFTSTFGVAARVATTAACPQPEAAYRGVHPAYRWVKGGVLELKLIQVRLGYPW